MARGPLALASRYFRPPLCASQNRIWLPIRAPASDIAALT